MAGGSEGLDRAAFTPGPWQLATFPGVVIGGALHDAMKGQVQSQVAMCTLSQTIDETQRNANARLIAAAPDLFEALKEAERVSTATIDYFLKGGLKEIAAEHIRLRTQFRAALAKASLIEETNK